VQRKPIVYFFVILPLLWGGAMGIAIGMLSAYSYITGIPPADVPNKNGLLILLPSFCLWIPVALVLGNCVLHLLPPLRRIAEDYTASSKQPGFAETQKMLLRITTLWAAVCIPLITLGFVL
jgi:hypothetical protein